MCVFCRFLFVCFRCRRRLNSALSLYFKIQCEYSNHTLALTKQKTYFYLNRKPRKTDRFDITADLKKMKHKPN